MPRLPAYLLTACALLPAAPAFAASWSFDAAGEAPGCARAPGRVGQALKLDGTAGMVVPHSPDIGAARGFTLECWIKPDVGPGSSMNIMTKPGEYMLRVDPAQAGGTISMYVKTDDGRWEPRARGPQVVPGKWQHIVAVWSRKAIYIWVNRLSSQAPRPGRVAATDSPLHIGGPVPGQGLAGFRGLIDEVRVHPRAFPYAKISRIVYGLDGPPAKQTRTNPRFEFDETAEGWEGDAAVTIQDGALCVTMRSDESMLRVRGLAIDAEQHPVCSVRMAATSGARGVMVFAGGRLCKDVPFRLIPDGKMRWYTLRCAQQPPWSGVIDAMGFRIEGARDAQVRIDAIRLGKSTYAPADLRVMSLSPERRINALGQPVEIKAWIRNFGRDAQGVAVTLSASDGIAVAGAAEAALPALAFDEIREVAWSVSAAKPLTGNVRADVTYQRVSHASRTRPIAFARDPIAASKAIARARVWQRAGYPRAMDFRHLFPLSVRYLEHDTALLVDFIGEKIPAAIEYKQRYPDTLVLMQVNDELNGIWGSWHVVPREFAVKEGLKFDPVIFPMPKFRGYWLLGPGATLDRDWPADAETVEVAAPETKWFTHRRYGRKEFRDVLVYRRVDGKADWLHSEYASVVSVDEGKKTITLRRWPREAVGEWWTFRAGQAYVAPSVGSIYRLGKGPLIKTWVPNLTKFCPRDPQTGLNAREWWARHFARLWRKRIAATEPHPDGFQFDGLHESPMSDCNNDGVVDGCEFGGINYWTLGLYDFFRTLREGGDEWEGLGDGLILADASNVWGPRDPSVLNGSENEEFPSFGGTRLLPEGVDLYRVWSAKSKPPSCSYVQGRFGCDTYLERDWTQEKSRGKFHSDGFVRFSIAAACMGEGIYTYRAGSKRDVWGIMECQEIIEYPWDEYHAGREGRFNWLGLPTSDAMRMTDHLGPDLLPRGASAEGWALAVNDARTKAAGPRARGEWIEANVVSIDTAGLPRTGRIPAARRVILLSPETIPPLEPGREYCVEFRVWADPQIDAREGKRFANVMRPVSVALVCGDRTGTMQSVLAGTDAREVALTLHAPARGRGRVAFMVGCETGPVRIAGLRLREGCAEVFARRFEHGLALANGSATSPYTFDLTKVGAGRQYRRFAGQQAPDVNNGQPVGERVAVPAQDGVLLMVR